MKILHVGRRARRQGRPHRPRPGHLDQPRGPLPSSRPKNAWSTAVLPSTTTTLAVSCLTGRRTVTQRRLRRHGGGTLKRVLRRRRGKVKSVDRAWAWPHPHLQPAVEGIRQKWHHRFCRSGPPPSGDCHEGPTTTPRRHYRCRPRQSRDSPAIASEKRA